MSGSGLGKHIAPHTAYVAALWSTLTRMRKPLPEKYPKGLADMVAKLTPIEKAELYAHGRAPDGLNAEQTKELLGNIDKIWGESDAYPNYEGRTGARQRQPAADWRPITFLTLSRRLRSRPANRCPCPLV